MCCCWFDRYCLKKYCESRNAVVIDRENEIENEIEIESDTESEGYSETDSEGYSETDSETDSENILTVKPDYDEDTEDEYGRPIALG